MKLASAMELIFITAVGLAVASWLVRDPKMSRYYTQGTWGVWMKDAADGFLAGAALAGCVGVWAERGHRRPPQPWGPGRWAWSVVGLDLLLHYGFTFVRRSGIPSGGGPLASVLADLPSDIRGNLIFWFRNAPPYLLIAVGATYLAGAPRLAPRADGREWAGRVFAVLTILSGIMNLFEVGIGF